MPMSQIPQIVENTADIAHNTSVISVLKDWTSVIFPVLGVIGAVFTWAWNRMQRSVDKMEEALTNHAKSNEVLFDDIYTTQREMAEKLNVMHGEHKALYGSTAMPHLDFQHWSVQNEATGQHLEEVNGE